MRLKLTVICLALIAIVAVGCGGSGGSSGGSSGGGSATESSSAGDSGSGGESAPKGKPLTKAAFIKEGDGICAKIPQEFGKKVKALEEEAKKKKQPKPSTAEINSKAAVPPLYVAVESFEELAPPKGDEQQAEAIIAALESAAKGVEQKPESELAGPKSPFAEFQKLTKAYGFEICSTL